MNKVKIVINRGKDISETTCEKIGKMPSQKQFEVICNILDGSQKCLQCGKERYFMATNGMVNKKNSSLKSYVFMCNCCNNMVDIEIFRGLLIPRKIMDVR